MAFSFPKTFKTDHGPSRSIVTRTNSSVAKIGQSETGFEHGRKVIALIFIVRAYVLLTHRNDVLVEVARDLIHISVLREGGQTTTVAPRTVRWRRGAERRHDGGE